LPIQAFISYKGRIGALSVSVPTIFLDYPGSPESKMLIIIMFVFVSVCSSGPIKHFIVLEFENRSFDHLLGKLANVDGIPKNYKNCIPPGGGTGAVCFAFNESAAQDVNYFFDPGHGFHAQVEQIYGMHHASKTHVRMDGFAWQASQTHVVINNSKYEDIAIQR
jgi:phospholipase C